MKVCCCSMAGTAACLRCPDQGTGIHWPEYHPLPEPTWVPVPDWGKLVPVWPVAWPYPPNTTTTWDTTTWSGDAS